MHLINNNLQHLFELCQKFKVKSLYVFGSILTPKFNDNSDVDILVDFQPGQDFTSYSDNFFGLYYALKNLFGRDVDLVDESEIKNPYFKKEINETKRLIYG